MSEGAGATKRKAKKEACPAGPGWPFAGATSRLFALSPRRLREIGWPARNCPSCRIQRLCLG
eukprot:3818587-Pyramimonas_sp.AAC.1